MKTTCCIVLVLLIQLSCKQENPVDPERFSGITETLNTCTPIGVIDPDDWKPMFDCPPVDTTVPAAIPTCTQAFPAYPNPANGSTTLYFTVVENDSIIISLYDRPNHVVDTIAVRRFPNGAHSYTVDLHGRELTIHRIYFSVIRSSGTYLTYGDVQVVE